MSTASGKPTTQPGPAVNPLLAAYLQSLATRPLLTKAVTSGSLSFLQEVIAGKLAGVPPPQIKKTGVAPVDFVKLNERAFQLGAYGFFLSAPLGHTLLGLLQKAFAGKTDTRSKILMILASNLIVSPIQNFVYVVAMAYINGARSLAEIKKFFKLAYLPVMRISWITSPICLTIAQRFLPPETWVPFFNLVAFVLGTYINTTTKSKALKASRAKKEAEKDVEKKKGQ